MEDRVRPGMAVASMRGVATALGMLLTTATAWAQTEVGGRIDADTTWVLAGSPYVVTSDIQVYGDTSPVDSGPHDPVTLTIEAGVEVRFDAGTKLTIGLGNDQGGLIAVGTAAQPIVLTGNATFPDPGFWDGVEFQNGTLDATTVLEHVVVETGGLTSSSGAGIKLITASPTLRNVTIRRSGNDCISIQSSSAPTIEASSFEECDRYGIRIDGSTPSIAGSSVVAPASSGIRLLGTSSPIIDGNTIEGGIYFESTAGDTTFGTNVMNDYATRPSRLAADEVGEFLLGATLNGTTPDTFLEVAGEPMVSSATWPDLGFPYHVVSADIDLNGADGIPAVLTLDPGVVVKFDTFSSGIFVATGTNETAGLVAVGTPAQPILLTSLAATPARGDWQGIDFGSGTDDANARLEYVTIEWAGQTNNGIEIASSSPIIQNCTIRESSVHGIHLTGSNASPQILNNSISDVTTNGIRISASGSAVIDGNTITNPGSYGIRQTGTTTATDSTITGNVVDNGLYYESASGNPTLTGNTFNLDPSLATRVGAGDVGELTGENTLNGTDASTSFQILGEGFSTDSTWPDLGFPYNVLGDITVRGDSTDAAVLTLQAGLRLEFNSGTELQIGNTSGDLGTLIAIGTPAEPIVLTTSNASPAPGQWDGLYFEGSTDDAATVVDNIVVEYAGNSVHNANIRTANSSPTIRNSTIRFSNVYGVRATGTAAGPKVLGNQFSDNGDFDFLCDSATNYNDTVIDGNTFTNGVRFAGTSGEATVTNNVFDDYVDHFLRVDVDTLRFVTGNVYNDTNEDSVVEVLGEVVTETATWVNQGVPYEMVNTANLNVEGDTENSPVLTLEPGVEIRFNTDGRLFIADGTNKGALVAIGTEAEPIIFTSRQDTPARGDFEGVRIDNASDDAVTVLEHVIIEYAGRNGTSCVSIVSASPTLRNVTCRESGNDGFIISGTSNTNPVIVDSTIQGVDVHAIDVDADDDGGALLQNLVIDDIGDDAIRFRGGTSAVIRDNVITNVNGFGIYFSGTSGTVSAEIIDNTIEHGIQLLNSLGGTRKISGNTLTDLAGFHPRVRASDVHQLVNFNTLEGADADTRIQVYGNTISGKSRWTDVGIVYHVISGDITIQGASDVIPAAMKVEPNVTIELDGTSRIRVGGTSGGKGILRAIGTEEQPILFTSDAEVPEPGDWEGIYFDSTSDDNRCELQHVVVEYAGANSSFRANVRVTSASPTIRNSIFRHSSEYGIYGTGTSSPVIEDNEFEGNADFDVRFDSTSSATLRGNTFTNGVRFVSASGTPTIENNTFDDYGDFFLRVGAGSIGTLADNVFNGVTADSVIEVVGERVSTSAQWLNLGIPYLFLSGTDTEIYGSTFLPATVTIEPGTTLKFDGVRIRVGRTSAADKGALVADGTPALPIVFTSAQETPAAGDWKGIFFDSISDNGINSLSNCVVEYGGQSHLANVRFSTSAGKVENCTIRHSSRYGVYSGTSSEGTLQLLGNTFTDNSDYDAYFSTGGSTDAEIVANSFTNGLFIDVTSGDPIIQNNVFDDYVDHFVRVGASSLDDMTGNTFLSASADAVLEVEGERISSDATWLRQQVPYRIITSDVSVYGDSSSDPATLTLTPGTTFQFQSGRRLRMSTTSSSQRGVLIAQGTAGLPITFTSSAETPAPGDWEGLTFDSAFDSADSLLEFVVIEYAGEGFSAGIRLEGAAPTVRNSIIRESSVYGIYAAQGTSSPVIENNTFEANADWDLRFVGTSNAVMTDNSFGTGVFFDNTGGQQTLTGNTFENYVAGRNLRIGASSIDSGFETNLFLNRDADAVVEISGETWGESRTWPGLPIPYRVVSGDVEVFSTSVTPVLTLEAGVEMQFATTGGALRISTGSSDAGALVVQGTVDNPVVLTSASETPAPGDWEGLVFGDGTDAVLSALDFLVVEYGGNGDDMANIRFNSAAPTITNCVVRDSLLYGLYITNTGSRSTDPVIDGCRFEDNADYDVFVASDFNGNPVFANNVFHNGLRINTATGDPSISGNTFNDYNTDHMLRIGASSVDLDFGTNVFNDTDATSVIEVIGEALSESQIWPAFQFPYRVVSDTGADINVTSTTSTPLLTIEAGTEIRFDSGRQLQVAFSSNDFGALIISGTAEEPVILTSSSDTPAPGDWEGIGMGIGNDNDVSVLEHFVVDYAGQTDLAGIRLNGVSPAIRNCTISNSSQYGIRATVTSSGATSATIEDCTFTGNADWDVFFDAGQTTPATPTLRGSTLEHGAWFDDVDALIEDNTFQTYADGFWVKLTAEMVGLMSGNVFEGIDETSIILVEGNNTFGETATWANQGPAYQVTERDITVFKDGITSADLTLEPGVEIRFETDRGLNIADASRQGGLIAVGTPAEPIVFTTADIVAPAAGQWESVDFRAATSFATVVEHAIVEYGGTEDGANVRIQSSSPVLRNVTIRNSSGRGIRSNAGKATIESSTIVDNATFGIWDDGSSNLVIDGNTITGNGDYSVLFTTTSNASITDNVMDGGLFFTTSGGTPTVTGNTFDLDGAFPIRVGADTVEQMGSNVYNGVVPETRLEIIGQQLSSDATWTDLGFPYQVISGTVHAYNSSSVSSTLTLEPGIEIQFDSGTRLRAGNSSSQGSIVAIGTEAEPILLTSSAETPAAGDWDGVQFDSGTVDATARLEWVTVEYAGAANSAGVYASSARPALKRTTVRHSSAHGLRLVSANADVTFCDFSDNASYGLRAESSTNPVLRHNRFVDNVSGAINSTSSQTIDGRLNYWGAADGPGGDAAGSGQALLGAVVFSPWLRDEFDPLAQEFHATELLQTTAAFAPGSRTRYFGEFSEDATWTLDVVDSGGGVVRTLSGSGAMLQEDFDGRDDLAIDLVEGDYTFVLSASSISMAEPMPAATGVVTIDTTLPVGEIDNIIHLDVYSVGSQIDVLGSAEMGGFTTYSLQYGTGLFPTSFTNIVNGSSTEVMADVLGTWNTNGLDSGTYALRLLVNNDMSEQTVVQLGSLILAINSLAVDRSAFSPNADGAKDDVTATATLSVASDWTIEVRDELDAVVRTFAGNGSAVEQVWDGTLADGTTVAPEGDYTLVLETVDEVTGEPVSSSVETLIDVTPPTAAITDPTDGGEAWSSVDIVGTAEDPNDNFEDYILEFGIGPTPITLSNIGSAVTSPVTDDVLGTWDTNDDEEGEIVVNGNYLVRLTANDTAGNTATDSVLVMLDNLLLGSVERSQEVFNPTLGEVLAVDYSVNKPADVTLTIYPEADGSAGTPVRSIATTVPDGGEYQFLWDGRDDGGVVVEDEAYVYVLDASGAAGRSDRFDPSGGRGTGANSGSIPGSYDPYTNDFWTIALNVSTGGRVRMTVTPSGEPGFQVVNREPFTVGVHDVYWDGRRPDGSIVEQSVNVFFDPPTTLRPHHVLTEGDVPEIVTLSSDPYLMSVSYGQVTDLGYTLSQDAVVTVTVVPAGIYDPADPSAVVLVDSELQGAGDHLVSWDALQADDPDGNLAFSELEGAYSFVVEATNPTSGRSDLRYGVINVQN